MPGDGRKGRERDKEKERIEFDRMKKEKERIEEERRKKEKEKIEEERRKKEKEKNEEERRKKEKTGGAIKEKLKEIREDSRKRLTTDGEESENEGGRENSVSKRHKKDREEDRNRSRGRSRERKGGKRDGKENEKEGRTVANSGREREEDDIEVDIDSDSGGEEEDDYNEKKKEVDKINFGQDTIVLKVKNIEGSSLNPAMITSSHVIMLLHQSNSIDRFDVIEVRKHQYNKEKYITINVKTNGEKTVKSIINIVRDGAITAEGTQHKWEISRATSSSTGVVYRMEAEDDTKVALEVLQSMNPGCAISGYRRIGGPGSTVYAVKFDAAPMPLRINTVVGERDVFPYRRQVGGPCLNCYERGHLARECKNEKKCRKCGQEGHVAGDCKTPEENKECPKCGKTGHGPSDRECEEDKKLKEKMRQKIAEEHEARKDKLLLSSLAVWPSLKEKDSPHPVDASNIDVGRLAEAVTAALLSNEKFMESLATCIAGRVAGQVLAGMQQMEASISQRLYALETSMRGGEHHHAQNRPRTPEYGATLPSASELSTFLPINPIGFSPPPSHQQNPPPPQHTYTNQQLKTPPPMSHTNQHTNNLDLMGLLNPIVAGAISGELDRRNINGSHQK